MLAPMLKVRIIGRREDLLEFAKTLHDLGVVHLVDANIRTAPTAASADFLTACEPDNVSNTNIEALRSKLRKLEEVGALLAVDDSEFIEQSIKEPEGWRERLEADHDRIRTLSLEREETVRELTVVQRYAKLCNVFRPIMDELGDLVHLRTMGITLDQRFRDQVLPALRDKLSEITGGGYQLLWRPIDAETLGVLLLYPKANARQVAELLSGENIHEVRLPRKYESDDFKQGLDAIQTLLAELPERIADLDEKLAAFRRKYAPLIRLERLKLASELEETEVVKLFAASRYLFVVEGYLPETELERTRDTLAAEFGDAISIFTLEIEESEKEEVPVVFDNPWFLKPFQRLLSLLPVPTYNSMDPTGLLAMSFPLFFGIILGDVGYGAILSLMGAAGMFACRANPKWRDIYFLLLTVGLSSTLFGFVYGELFGDWGHTLGLEPIWEDRMAGAGQMLVFTVALGGAHVLLSYLLAAFSSFRAKLVREGWAQLASVIAIALLFVAVAAISDLFPSDVMTLVLSALVGSLVLLVYLGGLAAALELVTAVGNILSYARLMALGLAGSALAMVANRLAGQMGSVAAAVAVIVLMHSVNIALGMFSPTIHSLRLHYVEFLPRFYKYGGKVYKPFKKMEVK